MLRPTLVTLSLLLLPSAWADGQALPPLVRVLDRSEVPRERALAALRLAGVVSGDWRERPEQAAALAQVCAPVLAKHALEDRNPHVRGNVLHSLGRLYVWEERPGGQLVPIPGWQPAWLSRVVLPALTAALTDAAPLNRAEAARSLRYLGPAASSAAPALAALVSEGGIVARCALESLVALGPLARTAEPDLRRLFADPEHAAQRPKVALALASLRALPAQPADPDQDVVAAQAQRLLSEALLDPCPPVDALGVVSQLGPQAAWAAPALARALEDPEQPRWIVARTLARLGPAGQAAGPTLLELARDPADPDAQVEAVAALGAIGHRAALPTLQVLLGDEERTPQVRVAAAHALSALGDPRALPALRARMTAPSPADADRAWLAGECARAAAELVTERPQAEDGRRAVDAIVADLLRLLKRVPAQDPSQNLSFGVLDALRTLGPRAGAAVPELQRLAADDPERALPAARTLARIAPPAAVGPLGALLTSDDSLDGCWAAQTLGELGPAAAPAVDALRACLQHRDARVRLQAAEALGRIGPAAARAREDLRRVAVGDVSFVAERARAALAAIGD